MKRDELMQKKMREGHPAPWAIFEADPDLMKRTSSDADFLYSVMARFHHEMDTDGDGFSEFENLFALYKSASEDYRMMIDAVFVHLCGWSFPTLLRMTADDAA